MPTIFAGVKKKNSQGAGPVEEPAEDLSTLKALADSILQAIASGNASALAQALKSFHLECEDYKEE